MRLGWLLAVTLSVAPAAQGAQTAGRDVPPPDRQSAPLDQQSSAKPDPQSGAPARESAAKPDEEQQQDPQKPKDPQGPPPIAQENKPTRSFGSALVHNIGDDFKHMPRMNTVYWLAGGAAVAAAVHPEDKQLNSHLAGSNGFWKAGEYIGATPTILAAGAGAYLIGRHNGSQRLQHLGMDELEAGLISEGLVDVAKAAVRRKRPLNPDGTRASGFSMPSGHATITFAAATVLQQHLGHRVGIPTYLIASYVAMSRLHLNVHYMSDVVMGAALGVVIGRSVTWHGRNFYASPMLLPKGTGIVVNIPTGEK